MRSVSVLILSLSSQKKLADNQERHKSQLCLIFCQSRIYRFEFKFLACPINIWKRHIWPCSHLSICTLDYILKELKQAHTKHRTSEKIRLTKFDSFLLFYASWIADKADIMHFVLPGEFIVFCLMYRNWYSLRRDLKSVRLDCVNWRGVPLIVKKLNIELVTCLAFWYFYNISKPYLIKKTDDIQLN